MITIEQHGLRMSRLVLNDIDEVMNQGFIRNILVRIEIIAHENVDTVILDKLFPACPPVNISYDVVVIQLTRFSYFILKYYFSVT